MALRDWVTGAVTATTMATTPAMIASTSQQTGIPTRALQAYVHAAHQSSCGVHWQDLAAVGAVETGHGTHGGATLATDGKVTQPIVSHAGAGGPMQFMPDTWAGYVALGVTDGDGDGTSDVNDIDDAARAAAEYLCRNGYDPADPTEAWGRYNGGGNWAAKTESQSYVQLAAAYKAELPAGDLDPAAPAPDLAARFAAAWRSLVAAAKRFIDEPVVTVLHDHDTAAVGPTGHIVSVHGIEVDEAIAPQVRALLTDADADGITLGGSGWRSTETTRELRVRNGCPDIDVSPSSSCDTPTALPGHSMHERGLAIDFDIDAGSPEHAWLQANAARYGLFNLPSEYWHWSTTGS